MGTLSPYLIYVCSDNSGHTITVIEEGAQEVQVVDSTDLHDGQEDDHTDEDINDPKNEHIEGRGEEETVDEWSTPYITPHVSV